MEKITIVVADDQLLTREGLRTILDLEDDMEVVGAAKNGEEACEMVETLRPRLVLLDIQMPVMDGIQALKHIKQSHPDIYILILTTFIETDYIVEGMAHGANGYMLKDMDADKMIASIRDTVAGQFILPAPVAAKLAARMSKMTEGHPVMRRNRLDRIRLTDREEGLARLMVQGLNNREIADMLHIAEGTARNYISNLYSKLEVVDRAQAIVRLQAML
ncbi:DNA-binding response regulator [Paenibacillus glucanolyticus]|uniref:response regulator n=1 Tax=Paenibacillus TaxID=44249 RepID=UPI0003E25486|nr:MULTISPECIES: response regulator transcription factor [Paenibacillus]ANA80509.1 DNA-binding response regulator [Paenibacillus glucanolyticus]AVV55422.1 DNA-binding response regulator [Paenibacillus glucanolyticus]ETT43674.1 LuxR family two component transcriptional regulator [Paenibacillus sp. FSL R5-808]MPY15736.1 response regulator transcription factor [Paenibacillus glucanolyticus]